MINREVIYLVEAACPEDASSGGCCDCGRVDGQDASGGYLLQFYTGEDSGEVWCPACGLKAVNGPMVLGLSGSKGRFLSEAVERLWRSGHGFHHALSVIVERERGRS